MAQTIKPKRHSYDSRTLVCSCGKTSEQHLGIELLNDRIKTKWFLGEGDLVEDFEAITKLIK